VKCTSLSVSDLFSAISVSDLIPERDTRSEDVFAVPRLPRDARPSISQSARYVRLIQGIVLYSKFCENFKSLVYFNFK
jgi:hypothetical protein